MSWYSEGFRKRAAITIDFSSGSSPIDVNVSIPYDWDDFWSEIDATGLELRVTHADGATLLDYSVDNGAGLTFDGANRAGRIQIDGLVAPASNGMLLCWVYYGTDGSEGTAAVVTTITSAKTGYIELGRPSQHLVQYEPQRPGVTVPRQVIHKAASEQLHVWIRLDPVLERRGTSSRGTMRYEELWWLTAVYVYDDTGSDTASMYTLTASRYVEYRGEMWLRVLVKAGTTAENYTLAPIVATTNTRTSVSNEAARALQPRIGISVRDVLLT